MTAPRRQQVEADAAGFYHCTARCVRQAFLCGYDPESERSYDHRKPWIEQRLRQLTTLFAIDVAAYAVMSNHLHVVLYQEPERARGWSAEEVVRRWLHLHPPRNSHGQKFEITDSHVQQLAEQEEKIAEWRRRLGDLSTFMAELNQWVAWHANREDGITGRFWEGRFKCQRLLDPAALLSCCLYVDLNPIRAKIADTPEESLYTSVCRRIEARRRGDWADWLMPIEMTPAQARRDPSATGRGLFFMTEEQYLKLVDWTGRSVREDKAHAIPRDLAPILQRLEIEPEKLPDRMKGLRRLIGTVIGKAADLAHEAKRRGTRRVISALRIPERTAQPPPAAASATA